MFSLQEEEAREGGLLMDKDTIPTIYTVACQHYHCSDGEDKQYPDCKLKENRLVCPALPLIDLREEIRRAKLATEED